MSLLRAFGYGCMLLGFVLWMMSASHPDALFPGRVIYSAGVLMSVYLRVVRV